MEGNAGGVRLPRGYLSRVYQEVRRGGGLCICDEVQTGYGRLGPASVAANLLNLLSIRIWSLILSPWPKQRGMVILWVSSWHHTNCRRSSEKRLALSSRLLEEVPLVVQLAMKCSTLLLMRISRAMRKPWGNS